MEKVEYKKFKSFWNKHLKFLSKHFGENGKENLNCVRFCRSTSLHVVMFPISLLKRVGDHIENYKFLTEKSGHFSWCQKIEIYLFFIIFEEFYQMPKIKHSSSNF